jgi:uncharacterized protein DUF4124
MSRSHWFLLPALLLTMAASAGGLYKWIDEQGGVHYSDKPPKNANARELETPHSPSREDADSAQQRAEQMKTDAAQMEQSRPSRAAPGGPLGPLPQNVASEYLTTTGSGVLIDFKGSRPRFSFNLILQARNEIPVGTYLMAHFENPANPGAPMVVTEQIKLAKGVKETGLVLRTPEFDMIRCKNYEVLVNVYRSESSRQLLGTHRQLIQSRYDSNLVTSPEAALFAGGPGGLCP